ncbi:hypothetical protein HPT25_20225 [Bacillus sp. BRMEA1]|uniref:hypothetical protein n=1 Tax=Neobacillus endophyticus TaxID=2738405 RepID=UPI001566EC20|nr:hypothetical protein [Neobacillus endophyticus]NRD79692.1 hypothetical protein [Neobacillus endophyticus]
MTGVSSVKFDGKEILVFNSAIYIFEASSGLTLELDIIVSEIVLRKYQKEENLIVEIGLEDGRVIHSIMHVKALTGMLPQLHLFCEIDDIQEYENFDRVNENDPWFPDIEAGITLADIRKVEMPNEDVTLKLKLPIDQVEWLKAQKKSQLNEMFEKWINAHLTNMKS